MRKFIPMNTTPDVYIVECFNEQGGAEGYGGKAFIASGVAFATWKLAEKAYLAVKALGYAASIRRLPLMGDLPKRKNVTRRTARRS